MVLIRMGYFRQHIIATVRKKSLLQSFRDRVVGRPIVTHSSPGSLSDSDDGQARHKVHGSHGIQASDGIGAALAAGATTGIGLGIALGTERFDQALEPGSPTPWNDSGTNIHIEAGTPQIGRAHV